jgi:V/A-type H+-transporting ATPase subunit D
MNLINTKKRIVLAKKGHSLLKRKREVLVIEFLKLLNESTNGRDYMQEMLARSYKMLAVASSYVGDFALDEAANYIREPQPIRMQPKNIMGVRIAEIEHSRESPEILKRGYSLLSTSIAVDDVNDSFNEALYTIVDVAKREQGLKRLVLEIEKVKRRVNALEYVLIPNLKHQTKYISIRLEEMERDTFSALKHVKKRLEAKEGSRS